MKFGASVAAPGFPECARGIIPKKESTSSIARLNSEYAYHQSGYSYASLRRVWTEADRLGYHSATLYDLLNVPPWNAGRHSPP